MLKAVESLPIRGGLVKCALVAGLSLFALPAKAQEVVCGPADSLREFLEQNGLKKTAVGTLLDGDRLEAWEGENKIVVTILIPDPKEPVRCIVKELGVRRKGQGA